MKLKMNIQFFADAITRTDAEALIDVQLSDEIFKGVVAESMVLKHARKLANMTSKQTKLRVLDSLPVAGFIDGDTGLKPTSKVDWSNVYLNAEEIAVIVPIPENVLDDASYDIWTEIKPLIVQEFANKIDGAVFFGTDAPTSWGTGGLVSKIRSAQNNVAYNANDSLYARIDKTMAKVEEDGFVANAILGSVKLKSGFRNMVDKNGQPITGTEIDSIARDYVTNGSWDDSVSFITGDFNNLVYAIRQDVTYKVLDQAVITDASGKVILNLAQQDMVALRVKMRLAYAVPNGVNALNPDERTRFPFALAEANA